MPSDKHDPVEESSTECFPASDPPAWGPLHVGEPGVHEEPPARARHAIWPLIKTAIFTVVVPGTVTGWVPRWVIGTARWRSPASAGALRWLALAVIAGGAAIYLRCAWDFAVSGRGTPAPIDPPRTLVARGLYRYVRNPMYVGVLTVLFGETLFFRSGALAVAALGIAIFFNLFVMRVEEPILARQFGASYDEYRRAVPRWIPRR